MYLYFHRLGYECKVDRTSGQVNKKVRNAQLAQWNYILVAGEDEMRDGLVDVRTRDNKRHGKMRCDKLKALLEKEVPKDSESFKEMYKNAWDPSMFGGAPADEEEKKEDDVSKAAGA